MQAGRTLQKKIRNKDSYILATEFLMGTDGRKMSKSWGNAIWLDDAPNDMFAKIMAIDDGFIIKYFALATNWPLGKIDNNIDYRLKQNENTINIKRKLAFEIVKELHDEKDAKLAQDNFEQTVQGEKLPDDIPIYQHRGENKQNIIDALIHTKLATSRSDAKRLVQQGGISVNDQIIKDPSTIIDLENDQIIRVGKRKFVKIKLN